MQGDSVRPTGAGIGIAKQWAGYWHCLALAHLDIAYPERLSRGLVLIKSWLLAIAPLDAVTDAEPLLNLTSRPLALDSSRSRRARRSNGAPRIDLDRYH